MLLRASLASFIAAVVSVCSASGDVAAEPAKLGSSNAKEDFREVPVPKGFRVIENELEGPVYADASGKTLYIWPYRVQRAGSSGDQIGKSSCGYEKRTQSDGILEPYPGGFVLPEVEKRRSCAEQWPPVLAGKGAKPTGAWTIVDRPDGKQQWAFEGYPLYTSIDDKKPGDVLGGTRSNRNQGGRVPVGPPLLAPPAFSVVSTVNGRLLATDKGASVYSSDRDRPGKSECYQECLLTWKPLLAPLFSQAQGEWSMFERAPGVKQWQFRGRPLYTYAEDGETRTGSVEGSDVPGWHNVYLQHVAARPSDFTLQDTPGGQVIADSRGHSIYLYNCVEDGVEQFACNRPESPQQYRLAVCGGGDVDKCLKLFPYVPVSSKAKNESRLWDRLLIDVRTGQRAEAGDEHAVLVWAYRGSPVYTYSGDRQSGTIKGEGWGEGSGGRNGFRAFIVREDFYP